MRTRSLWKAPSTCWQARHGTAVGDGEYGPNATLLAWPPGHEVAEHATESSTCSSSWSTGTAAQSSTANPTTWWRAARFSSRAEHAGTSRPIKLTCATSQSTGAADHYRSRRHRTADELNAPRSAVISPPSHEQIARYAPLSRARRCCTQSAPNIEKRNFGDQFLRRHHRPFQEPQRRSPRPPEWRTCITGSAGRAMRPAEHIISGRERLKTAAHDVAATLLSTPAGRHGDRRRPLEVLADRHRKIERADAHASNRALALPELSKSQAS
jgi:hypothetical protein